MSGHLDQIVLPGTELEALPDADRKSPVAMRVVRVYPHGNLLRYDLEYQAFEPGSYDLRRFLRRKDGSSTADLPPLPVQVTTLLPPGQVLPNDVGPNRSPSIGGYRTLLIVAGVAWVLGLVAILYVGFLRRRHAAFAQVRARPFSLADRLRPLVEGAMAGKLSQVELASLERMLLAYWRKRLGLEQADPAQAIADLRTHAEAGPLLEQLECWLHRPGPAAPVDPARLLAPYQDLPADALTEEAA